MIESSLRRVGAARSGVIDENGVILAGNGTYEALAAAGINRVKVVEADGNEWVVVKRTGLSEEQKRLLALADNRSAELAEWDPAVLAIQGIDLDPWFTSQELRKIGAQAGEIGPDGPDPQLDKAEALREQYGVELGQIWQLGEHRLACGDSTSPEQVAGLMQGDGADAVVTDPPYGMNLDTDWSSLKGSMRESAHGTSGNKYAPVIGDDKPYDPTPIFESFGYCDEIFLFGADYYAEKIPDRGAGSWLVWDKRKESQAEAIGSEFELCWSKARHKRRILRHDWFGFLSSENPIEARNRVHPTQKPTALIQDILQQWVDGKIIVDPFLGSGTTLIACEQLGRKCYAMEISPAYVAVAIQRWADLTGNKPKLL